MKVSDEQLSDLLRPFFHENDHVRLENVGAFRRKRFKGIIADHALNVLYNDSYDKNVLVVFIKRISSGAVEIIGDVIDMTGKSFRWALVDYSGECLGCMEDFDKDRLQRVVRSLRVGENEQRSAPTSLFTATNEWLLKILLLGSVSDEFWGGPRLKGFSRLSELVCVSGLPQSTVSRFVSSGERNGFFERRPKGIHFSHVQEMFHDWAFVHHMRRKKEPVLKVDSLYPGETFQHIVDRLGQSDECVFGGHYAARLLGIGRSNVSSVIVYVESIEDALERFDVTESSSSQSGITLVQSKKLELLKKGAPHVTGSEAKVTDPIQIYLDLFNSLDRGREQAEFIFERLLTVHFKEELWRKL